MYNKNNAITLPENMTNQIFEQWSPLLQESKILTEGVDRSKAELLTKIAHIQMLNEDSSFGTAGFSTLSSIPGLGNPSFGATLGGQSNFVNGAGGSGDKWLSPFSISLQVAAKTVGFDIVSTIPIQGPTGMIYYVDYIYADGRLDGTGNDAPKLFQIPVSGLTANVGQVFIATNQLRSDVVSTPTLTGNAARLKFAGTTRIEGYPIFQLLGTGTATGNVVTDNTSISIAQVFDGTATLVPAVTSGNTTTEGNTGTEALIYAVTGTARYVNAMEDNVYGFANGAGGQDSVVYEGNFINGQSLYEPALRGTAESERYQDMGVKIMSKNIETKSFKVAITVTQEQLQDMKKQHGFDLLVKAENALVNEITQNINKNILARAFALGWTNHANAFASEGINLNIALDPAYTSSAVTATYAKNDGTTAGLTVPYWQSYASSTASFENQETVQRRIASKIFGASDVINQRGRFGPATGIVTNLQVASALRNIANYSFSPFSNNLSQTNGNLYPMGKVGEMPIYVDPNMKYSDTRVLVFRKGNDDEPGLKFLPYLLGETVQTIQPNTASPKIFVSSRYALTEYGQRPETQYLTFFVKVPAGGIV
jgi:hypothetical protein